MNTLCLVSAFYDIGRAEWHTFRRSLDQYFDNFAPYVKFTENNMVVFIDERHVERLRKVCGTAKHIKIIPINDKFMEENIWAYGKLEREREIMQCEKFKKLVQHRLHHPECCKPEYNIMQHAKIDFVNYVINHKLSDADYYAWTDFGYFQLFNRIPAKPLDLAKFDLNRVNFQAMDDIQLIDNNILYTLQNAPEKVGGFFYLGNKALLAEYQTLYHNVYEDFHRIGIVDDDQHFMLQCIFRRPDLFKIWNLKGWHLVYLYFQRS